MEYTMIKTKPILTVTHVESHSVPPVFHINHQQSAVGPHCSITMNTIRQGYLEEESE